MTKKRDVRVVRPEKASETTEPDTGDELGLFSEHLADLRKSGLNDDMIRRMGVESLDADELARELGYRADGVRSALKIPYLGIYFARYKLFPPPDGGKYTQQAGTGCHFYYPPGIPEILDDPDIELFLTEGEKKAALLTQEGCPCVGLGGLWNFMDKDTGEPIAELRKIKLPTRSTILVPDSDVWGRPDLERAVYAFGRILEECGAAVSALVLK